MTVDESLRRGEALLRAGPHPERARRDAELLLAHALRWERARLLAHYDDEIPASKSAFFDGHLARRAAGEPVQYILGETEFYGLAFRVVPDVLIPRPETEHVVETVIELSSRFSHPRIVDVGCGSGAIAVALAHSLPGARVTATDISAGALAIARENAARNGVDGRIRFLQGDLLELVAGERFELIVSNPPYVANADRKTLAAEVREHEPAEALFAGEDGMEVIRRLIPPACKALVPGGFLVLEIGHDQSTVVGDLLSEAGFEEISFVPDLQGIPRVACAQRP
ncbi:MAG TPA: peptide chain release factor N(5)-glutamine methyltransferase [Terracidiphilus sp.]|nr:peptide chain release factor N(5)-glutamine methyltransferase [Terracidiphilus sp.]